MEVINHFNHTKHSLKLFENFEVIVAGGDIEIQGDVDCSACLEPILSGPLFGCISCRYFLHQTCAHLERTLILHELDSLHPLILKAHSPNLSAWSCELCDRKTTSGLYYFCAPCDLAFCVKCVVATIAKNVAAAALEVEASIKLQHEGHPQHTLTLQLRSASFYCDACKDKDEDFFYRCDYCDFWIHKTCASLDLTIDRPHHHNHPLILAYSLPEHFYNFAYFCEFCNKRIMHSDWIYHYSNCRYFIHIKCILKPEKFSTPRDGQEVEDNGNDGDLLQFLMSDALKDPLKLLHCEKLTIHDNETVEIKHWSHNHPLHLNVLHQGNNMIKCSDLIEVCYGCVQPLSLPCYSCKDGCSFTLHKYCAELPLKLEHPLHPNHSLDLINTRGHGYYYSCIGCYGYGNTFLYTCETCKFYIDVNCAFLPNTIKHKSHKHRLNQVINPKAVCNACKHWNRGMSYGCSPCNFILDMHCAMRSPHSLSHRYCKGHEVPLTYPPVIDHPEDFYCDICETEMHPKFPLYYCYKCKNSFHLGCISRINYFANIFWEGTRTVPYHKHRLTYVRRKKTPKYVCSNCNRDINSCLILECRGRVCSFSICYECHYKKVMYPL